MGFGTKIRAHVSRRHKAFWLPAVAIGLIVVSTETAFAQLVLEGDFIRTGVGVQGTLGVGGNTSPGFIFDPTGTRTFNPSNDYLTPGTPFEGFSLSYNGSSFHSNNNDSFSNSNPIAAVGSPVVVSSPDFDNAISWSGSVASTLNIEHLYGLNNDSKRVEIRTTITALTDLNDLKFARFIDPDSGGTNSINTRGNATLGLAPEDWVNSESEANGATLGLYSNSNITHNTAISPWWSIAPDDYIAGSGDTIGDDTIGIGFDIGTLLNGQSITFIYFYAVGADANDFNFGTASFASKAVTPNQLAVATYLDNNASSTDLDFQALLTQLRTLPDNQLQNIMQQMSGEIYGTTQQMGIQNITLILHTIAQQLQPQSFNGNTYYDGWAMDDTVSELSDSEIVQVSYQAGGGMQVTRSVRPRTTWVAGFGLGGNADNDGNATGLDYGMGGALAGFDIAWNRGHRIGLYGGYVGTGIETNAGTARNEINSGQIGTYITGRNEVHYYTIINGFQFDGYDSQRNVGGLVAQGDYDGWQGFSYLERGLVLYSSSRWSCQPFGGLQYVHIRQDGFTETGAGPANLTVDNLEDDSLRSLLGVRAQVRTVPSRRNVTPEFRAVWVHEFLDTDSPVVARFAPIGGAAFIAEGLDMGRDWALVGTGLNFNLGRGWSAQANYDAQVNEHQAFHVGSGSVTKMW